MDHDAFHRTDRKPYELYGTPERQNRTFYASGVHLARSETKLTNQNESQRDRLTFPCS